MRSILLFLLLSFLNLSAQDKLRNTYNSWHEVIGGVEGSGTQRTESYLFVASARVTIAGLFYENKEIVLKKCDSLQVNVHSHKGDPDDKVQKGTDLITTGLEKDKFRVFKKNRIYYLNVMHPYVWNKKVEYTYKKKKFTVNTKPEFDTGRSDAAP